MGMPTVNSVGNISAATTTITPGPGASHAVDDIDVLLLSSGGGSISLTTAAGFTEVSGLAAVTGTETGGARMAVFWRRWNGTDGNPQTNDPGNVIVGRMISISGCKTSGDPWNVLASGTTDSSADTSVSVAGATTTAANCLVLAMCSQALPDANNQTEFGSPTNASLANLTTRINNAVVQGLGQAIWMVSGEKATAGAYSATTCTATTSSVRVCGSLALQGADDVQPLTGTLFTNTPSFFTGVVSSIGHLAGALFQKAPTFFTGVVQIGAGGQSLTGTLFAKAPTFPTGVLSTGYVGGLPAASIIAVWDARSLTGTAGTAVASWADIGPKAQAPLAQATSGFRPTITDSGFGGIRSVLFDGVDDRLFCSALDQTYTGDFAFLTVLETLSFANGSSVAIYSTGAVPDYKNILGLNEPEDPQGWVIMSGPEGTEAEHHRNTALDLYDVPVRVVMTQLVRDSGIHKLWERTVLVHDLTDSAGGDPLNNLTALQLGSREDDSRFANIRVAYMMLVDMSNTDESTLLLARDELGQQFAVPGMDTQALQGATFTMAPNFFIGGLRLSVRQRPNATTSNDGWDTGPTPGQAIHTYLASDDSDYVTVTVA